MTLTRVGDEPSPATGLRRRRTLRGERRREELLAAVVDHVLEHGVADFSLRGAAKAAGTSHRILSYHFGSADKLLRDALAEIRRPMLEAQTRALRAPDADPMETAWKLFTGKTPIARVLLEVQTLAATNPEYRDIARDLVRAYLPVVEEAVRPDLEPSRREAAAALVLAVIRGLLLDARSTGELDRARRALELFGEVGMRCELLVERGHGGDRVPAVRDGG
jgi:AcrR family transcriptional regulator